MEVGQGENSGWELFPAPTKIVYWYMGTSLLTRNIRGLKLSSLQYGNSVSQLPIVINLSEGYKLLHGPFPWPVLICTQANLFTCVSDLT